MPAVRGVSASAAVLAGILLAGTCLRVVNIDHGLPFVYYPDEARHFTNRAVAMFGTDLDPGYYRNPTAYTYAVHIALRIEYGVRALLGDAPNAMKECLSDPSAVYRTARIITASLCMLGVAAVYAVGRLLWGVAEGLAAAAVLALAFLPVAYSRFALTDVATLFPVAIAVYAAVRAQDAGRLRHFAVFGAAAGLAVAFKYTAGLLAAPLLAACLLGPRGWRAALPGLAAATCVGTLVFVATNPFFVLHLGEALEQLRTQSATADRPKLGQRDEYAHVFYLRSLTWGLGWGATIAAAIGAVWELRRNRRRALVLLLFPVLLFVFLCTAERFFARWLLPTYPVLALLAGLALTRIASRLSKRPAIRSAALAVLLALVLAQPLVADMRTAVLLGRTDTRRATWDYLIDSLPARTQIVIEPAIHLPAIRAWLAPGFHVPRRTHRGPATTRFIRSLHPQLIDQYRLTGHCYVVTFSSVRGRIAWSSLAPAEAYYRRLESESTVIFRAEPYRDGHSRPAFDLDFTMWLHYPPIFERPGPEAIVYRLDRCRPVQAPPPVGAPLGRSRTLTQYRLTRAALPITGRTAARVCGYTLHTTPAR